MSKGFKVKDGDIVINNKTIEMVEGSENLRTKAELVIGTNQGEWDFDLEEGIDFHAVLRKNPDDAEIRGTIENALRHSIDDTFVVTEYNREMDGRKATITSKAVNAEGAEVGGVQTYGN